MDFYSSLEKAREIAADVKGMLQKTDETAEFFPYRSVGALVFAMNVFGICSY